MNQHGSELFVRGHGRGPTVVLLHGWGFDGRVWRDLVRRLQSRWHVVCVDLPGHGRSAPWPSVTAEAMLAALARAVPEPAHWLGWSLGATLALALAAARPARVRRLVLVGATPCFVTRPHWHSGTDLQDLQEFARRLREQPGATLSRFVARQGGGPADGPAVNGLEKRFLARTRPGALAPALALLEEMDLRRALAAVTQRTLVIHGRYDRVVPLAAGQALVARMPRAELQCYDTGHAPFLVEPARFAAAVDEFLGAP